jgi:hypothetical protein
MRAKLLANHVDAVLERVGHRGAAIDEHQLTVRVATPGSVMALGGSRSAARATAEHCRGAGLDRHTCSS